MDDLAKAAVPKRKPRKAHEVTVTGRRQISLDLVRLSTSSPVFAGKEPELTSHYTKLLPVSEDAGYSWPFDIAQIRAKQSRNELPVTRTYILTNLDSETSDFGIDFVTHGDSGLAGPWACVTKVGDKLGLLEPGGAWGPAVEYEHFVLTGDESTVLAIGVSLKHLSESMATAAYIKIEVKGHRFKLPTREGVGIHWVFHNGTTYGIELSRTVRETSIPEGGKTSQFIHGIAEMIKELRRFLFAEPEIPKKDVSTSSCQCIDMAEDQ